MTRVSTTMADDGGNEQPSLQQALAAGAANQDVLAGERFGKYLIVGEVAVGGMAEVFLGVQRGIEGFTKVVVIKRVLPQFGESSEFVRMFVDEARLAARLEHPNIVRTYEFGEVAGRYFTAMEYLPGEDLNKVLVRLVHKQQQLPLHLAAAIMAKTCTGLHFAHEITDTAGRPLGLVHRDVNPANIVVTYGGEVKIIDFGVAKTNENAQTMAGTIKGKIAYMAPEQLLARGVDRRSDVFSAGVVLWELITGRPLFLRDNEAATLYAIMNDPIRAPSRYRAGVPPELDAIVLRALSRTPADRYESAEEMAAALDGFLAMQFTTVDARTLARMLEELFGPDRAEAKRGIAQTRALGRNISLVMKLRTEVRDELVLGNETFGQGSDLGERPAGAILPTAPAGKSLPVIAGIVLLLALAAGAVYWLRSDAPHGGAEATGDPGAQAQAALTIETTPPGAAISLDGEPTGLTTPATLSGLTAGEVAVRLALPGHTPITRTLTVKAGRTDVHRFELTPETK